VKLRELITRAVAEGRSLDDEVLLDTPETLNAGAVTYVRSITGEDGRHFVVLEGTIDSERPERA
jgi:hypothetical protein